MSDCVYHAFQDNMRFYGLQIHPETYNIFRAMKAATIPAEAKRPRWNKWRQGWNSPMFMPYTYGGVVPWILTALANLHGLDVVVEHRIWTPEIYIQKAETPWQATIANATNYKFGKEVERISLEPAMYLMLDGVIALHAQFFEQVPTEQGVCVAAIALTGPIPVSRDEGETHGTETH